MSHHIYHTRGIILASQPSGESNRFYKIFTEELGLVGATAQSVREGKSKLRYTLQDLSLITLDLVRGKEVWRIVSAGAWKPQSEVKNDPTRTKLLGQYFSLLSRLLQGEGRDQELFDEIVSVADFLEKGDFPGGLELALETMTALRVLVHLGYCDPSGYEDFLGHDGYSIEKLAEFEKIRTQTPPKINQALNASHL